MTALSANASRVRKNLHGSVRLAYAVDTAAVIYQSSLVCVNEATGRAIAATAAAARTFLGVSEDNVTGVAAGTVTATVRRGHIEKIAKNAALTNAYIGCNVAVEDDNTVTTLTDAGTAGVQVRVGEMVAISGSFAWVLVGSYSEKDAP